LTPLSLRFALRELRGGVRGFRIFLACLALGVAAIAAAGSTAQAFRTGLATEARAILGGDLAITRNEQRFSAAERAIIQKRGPISDAVASRGMAQAPNGERRLVEIRGVDAGYPLAGKVEIVGAPDLRTALADRDGVPGAVVEQALIDRLQLNLGDRIRVGQMELAVRGVVLAEPDRLSRGFQLGPRVMTRLDVVERSGLISPGLPFAETIRVSIDPALKPSLAADQLKAELKDRARVRHRDDAAPGLSWLIDQLEYFLSFIGLASLIAGGLGVFGAVSAYLETRRPPIAALKALGAEGSLIRNVYLIQIAVLAALGVVIGLAVGAAAPLILGAIVGDELPVPALFAVYPAPLAKAAAFGFLSAAAFSLVPLAQARSTPPASLFRRDLPGRPGFSLEMAGALLAAAGLAALAILTAPTLLAAVIMIAGVTGAFIALWLLGLGAAALAGKLRGLARGPARLGLANLSGPHSAARTASPAIGLGVALLASVVLIQSSLLHQVAEVAPKSAPAVIFTDIPGGEGLAFQRTVEQAFGRPLTNDDWLRAPVSSGRITAIRGKPVVRSQIPDGERWAFDNDVSLSVIGPEPPNAEIVAGKWWPALYQGPPLLALEADAARAVNLRIGDSVTLEVLGRQLEARIAVLRKVEVGSFGPSFPLILPPSALEGAVLTEIAIAKSTKAEEEAATRALGSAFPMVNVISVREQLEAATDIFDRLALAVRGAAAVAGLAGVLVLAGAIAARARARTREAATLKVLGASRGQILAAYVIEYGAVGLIAGVAGVALGYAAAWPVVVKVFETEWSVDWAGVVSLVGGAAALTGVGGLLAALQALSKRPAPALRAE